MYVYLLGFYSCCYASLFRLALGMLGKQEKSIGGLPAREIIRIIVKENWVFLLLGVEVGSRLLHY